jgi:copper chaperone CopZ
MERTLRVDGMHCRGCARSVGRYLRSEPGVATAAVSYEDGRADLTVAADVDVTALCRALGEMGYEATVLDGG